MNLQDNSTRLISSIQETFKNRDNKILPHLPQQMDEMAKRAGAMQRRRCICSAVDLLRMLFLYAGSKLSFRILAVAACALGISDISDTAWRRHFSRAAPFLREILHSLLSSLLPAADASALEGIKNVLPVDTSVIRQDGKLQAQQRIHLCCSLNENRMKQVKVSDKHTAESLTHFSMGVGDLVMADAGYGTAQNYIYAQEQGAEYCGEEILHLYRSRWQAELLFKRFRQNFSIRTIKAGSSSYAETETLLWLIIWTIAERQSFRAECFLAEKYEASYSVYEECKISFIQITDVLRLFFCRNCIR